MQNLQKYLWVCDVRHGNVNSIQNPSTVTNPTMEPYGHAP